jgi:SAM-dependent methyltransferase
MLISKLRILFNKFQFSDKFISLFLNPFFLVRKQLASEIKSNSSFLYGNLLDVGSGTKPYKLFFKHCITHIGLEIEPDEFRSKDKNVDFYYDGGRFPFDDSKFDSILCNQVLEHVFDPDLFLSEINRVLKPSGMAIITVPFLWGEHEVPHDFGRYSSYGLKYFLKKKGFKIIKFKKLGNIFTFNLQYLNLFYLSFFKKKYFLLIPLIYILTVFNNLIGSIFFFIDSSERELYIDNFILIQKNNL